MNFQGHVEKGMVVLDQLLPLPDGTPVVVEPVMPANPDFWQPTTLDELAARQGVATPTSPDELAGGWPTEDLNDDFEKALGEWRQRG